MNAQIKDLTECTLAAEVLQQRPPSAPAWLLGTGGLLLAAVGVWMWQTQVDLVVRVRGRVRPIALPTSVAVGEQVLTAGVSGRIVALECREGDPVRAGQVLLQLDTSEIDREIAAAQAGRDRLQEELDRLRQMAQSLEGEKAASVRKSEQEVEVAEREVELERARCDRQAEEGESELACARLRRERVAQRAHRVAELVEKGLEAREKGADAQAELEEADALLASAMRGARRDEAPIFAAQARCETARLQVETTRKELETRQEELRLRVDAKEGQTGAARSALDSLAVRRDAHLLRARCDGVVTACCLRDGEHVQAGQIVLTIASGAAACMEADLPARDRAQLHLGQEARIWFDSKDGLEREVASGTVRYISPDSHVDEQGQVCYRIRVELRGAASELGHGSESTRMGMPGDVEVRIGEARLATLLFRRVRGEVSFR